jgi:hypothetical protein
MPEEKPTGKTTRSEQYLDRVDRMLAERGADRQHRESFDDPEEITSRQQVEEIARQAAENAIRVPVHVVIFTSEYTSPQRKTWSTRRRACRCRSGADGFVAVHARSTR